MTIDEKRQALDEVLQSRVLRRCEQLKKMLQFVCVAEFEGRGAELSEYLIGTQALGRPTSYSPAEDSIVRTRAYELRNKLTKYYTTEAPDTPIRIEIERGAYVPRFIRRVAADTPGAASSVTFVSPKIAATEVASKSRPWARVSVVVAFAALAMAAYAFLGSPKRAGGPLNAWTPEMETFWKPFLAADTPLMLTYNPRLFLLGVGSDLMVRHWRTNEVDQVAQSAPLLRFQKQMGVDNFVESRNYVDFGALYSLFLLMRTVDRQQNQMLLKSSKDLDWTDVFNDNVIFLGGVVTAQPQLREFQEAGDFVEKVGGIVNLHPKPGEQKLYAVNHMTPVGADNGEKYALLSRFPGPQRGRYVMLLGSAHSELPWALAEYITNPLSIRELVQHLKLPSGELPDAFQVVLRVTLQAEVPVRVSYVTHHVVTPPEFSHNPKPQTK